MSTHFSGLAASLGNQRVMRNSLTQADRAMEGFLSPEIRANVDRDAALLLAGYLQAAAAVRRTKRLLEGLDRMPASGAQMVWDSCGLAKAFGGASTEARSRVRLTVNALDDRVTYGFASTPGRQRSTLSIFPTHYSRCKQGLLANASTYGHIRICPSLPRRPIGFITQVLLHELMHQRLGVRDVRSPTCKSGDECRCYREKALALVRSGQTELALRNIDNYVYAIIRSAEYLKECMNDQQST